MPRRVLSKEAIRVGLEPSEIKALAEVLHINNRMDDLCRHLQNLAKRYDRDRARAHERHRAMLRAMGFTDEPAIHFRALSRGEAEDFKRWARRHYEPGMWRNASYHPVVRYELWFIEKNGEVPTR